MNVPMTLITREKCIQAKKMVGGLSLQTLELTSKLHPT
ncbi:hypothetical protein Leryth_000993 [Lithospermum erythrorhizon]|nr:hypothetical protein Leryth_000993 [Lithospermum erythrorhizon]